jgi:hypothetical protein
MVYSINFAIAEIITDRYSRNLYIDWWAVDRQIYQVKAMDGYAIAARYFCRGYFFFSGEMIVDQSS